MIFIVYSGFYIDRKAAPARVACILLPVLTLMNMMVGVSKSLPQTDYYTWLEECLQTGLLFAFCGAIQYAIVSWNLVRERSGAPPPPKPSAEEGGQGGSLLHAGTLKNDAVENTQEEQAADASKETSKKKRTT